jgi:hypothetical protein
VARAAIELHQIAADVARIPDAGLYAAAKLVKQVADEQARRATGDGAMNGKHRPIRLKARDKGIRPINDGRAILITGTPAGPWVWIDSGTAPHAIRRRKRGPMRNMTVHHPGTRGRHAWVAVVDRATELVPRIFTELADRAVT